MKKILIAIVIFIVIFTSVSVLAEEPQFSVADKIRSFMLPNNPAALEKVTEARNNELQSNFDEMAKNRKYTEEEIPDLQERHFYALSVIPEYSFSFYPFVTMRYTKQYADANRFEQLIGGDKIWAAGCRAMNEMRYFYDTDYVKVDSQDEKVFHGGTYTSIADLNTIKFLNDSDKIEQMVRGEINEKIVDCKIVAYTGVATFIYLKGGNKEYGIKIYCKSEGYEGFLENFKIYTMSELIESFKEREFSKFRGVFNQKPTYEAEATALQDEGLIQGNENGLDLLKPLSRIEATTILVRALGYENEPTEITSQFTDIPNGNWAVKYANIAKEKGLSNGVGDNKFAPDERVTSDQFATLLLRNFEADDFDWQTATQMLIDKNIITAEQADTMDLFTRGDMAKIIYEAKQKGLLN